LDNTGRVQVYLRLTNIESSYIAELEKAGLDIELINDTLSLVQGWIHYQKISDLALVTYIERVDLPKYAQSHRGSKMTEGDKILLADKLRAKGYTGKGVRIGIISDGGNDMEDAIATGDLPQSVQRFGRCVKRRANNSQCSPAWYCNEGTAMAEIIHDIAPDAALAIGAVSTSLEFIERIKDLSISFRAHIIVDDIGFLSEPYFADGDVAEAVSNLADDVIFVSAAGNSGEFHYEAEFKPIDIEGVIAHSFSTSSTPDPTMDIEIAPDGYVLAVLQWNDQFGNSGNDYELGIGDGERNVTSEEMQSGFGDPIEAVCYHNNSLRTQKFNLAITKYSGVNRRLEMFVFGRGAEKEYNVASGSIFGHAGVASVISVAAINVDNERNVTDYSSRGPSRIDFPFRQNRRKPDVAGIDGVSVTGTGGFPSTFFGTSAAAPHIAAVAGLLLDAAPNSTPAEIKAALMRGAIDIESFGFDSTSGAGQVDAVSALSYLNVPGDSDDDGVADNLDFFPYDPRETTDTDGDGIGNNADTDDDGDGLSDVIEIKIGYDPLDANDATGSSREILWRNAKSGRNILWSMEAGYIVEENILNTVADSKWKVIGMADFTGDGLDEIFFRHQTRGENRLWLIEDGKRTSSLVVQSAAKEWQLAAMGDFDGDGDADLVWRNQKTGANRYWEMARNTRLRSVAIRSVPLSWSIAGSGDFDGDGLEDLIWRSDKGANTVWLMDEEQVKERASLNNVAGTWKIAGTGDFDMDGMEDLFWHNPKTGSNSIWLINGTDRKARGTLPSVKEGWRPLGVEEWDGDEMADILWKYSGKTDDNKHALWRINGTSVISNKGMTYYTSSDWESVAVGNVSN